MKRDTEGAFRQQCREGEAEVVFLAPNTMILSCLALIESTTPYHGAPEVNGVEC